MLSKIEIRREIRTKRNSLSAEAREVATERILTQFVALEAVRDAKIWFVYVSAGSEPGTQALIGLLLARGNTVLVPRIVGPNEMIPRQIRDWQDLQLGEFGILAPPPGEPYWGNVDVCICPGIAFTEQGERLGAGRGFYDRYLAAHPPRLAIGLAFKCQLVPQLPLEIHDRRMDYIITEDRIIHAAP